MFPWRKKRAIKEIAMWVQSYKRRCTGNNRFVVTPETLQDSFREYDFDLIQEAWQYLVDHHIIQQDIDNEWCIK